MKQKIFTEDLFPASLTAHFSGSNDREVMALALLLLPLLVAPAAAFTAPISYTTTKQTINDAASRYMPISDVESTIRRFGLDTLYMASDGNDDEPRKRRKRKDGKTFSPPKETEKNNIDTTDTVLKTEPKEAIPTTPSAPKENVVVMQVRDIRDVVSGVPETPVVEEDVVQKVIVKEELEDGDDELADDEEWEYYDVDEDGNEIIASQNIGRTGQDESMEQLLADARSMRASSTSNTEVEETPLKNKILEVIATIVTIDFFVVLGLLAWFLVGIFCSYVLKDDAVQIAFNMNFEGVTRP